EFHGGVLFSCHLSGIVKGFTHVIALAGDASAVAVASMFTVGTPKSGPISVGIGLLRAPVRNTLTLTRLFPVGPAGNVTSAGVVDGDAPITLLASAVLTALCTAGPPVVRSSKLLNASAVAPASAPASAAFCACDRAVMNMPTSMASVDAATNAMKPSPMKTNDMPRSSRRRFVNLFHMAHLDGVWNAGGGGAIDWFCGVGDRYGSFILGSASVTPGDSVRRISGVIITTSSVRSFCAALLRNNCPRIGMSPMP